LLNPGSCQPLNGSGSGNEAEQHEDVLEATLEAPRQSFS
jgi:hypothetical protein